MATPVYLWLTNDAANLVKGSVDINGREGSIEIVEFMHAIELPTDDRTGKITSKRIHGDYAIIKELDSSSLYLYQGVTTGQRFQKAELKFYQINENGQEVEYFRTTLENVRINEIEPFMFICADVMVFSFMAVVQSIPAKRRTAVSLRQLKNVKTSRPVVIIR
ncbi:type VI secretion system tube protein TssD [Rahnella perminowiae]|uniref:Type VI secretion system tube protein Hcp n=1 Tax=Rahnella perminowiae TaxID=2816244 RepID=A0ABS6KXD4_9GAMM|nr:type VI secretion system tube protein TssD [Rahnella perminowiae]MBU9834260.1 type VI secretion system tube protein Hcp [Rahnella perminowiae]MCR9002918.1 type VI secretion system tube protein Hcp [Rahnella perminowiae]